jgi:hypothetical protein
MRRQGSGEDARLMFQMLPTLWVHPSYFTSAFGKQLADQCSQSSVIPTSSRIDIDHFQYGGILSKVERVGLGEEVDAGEEEE